MKTVLSDVDVTVPTLLRPDGSPTYCRKEMAALFTDMFYSKRSYDRLAVPQSNFPEAKLTCFMLWGSLEIIG